MVTISEGLSDPLPMVLADQNGGGRMVQGFRAPALHPAQAGVPVLLSPYE